MPLHVQNKGTPALCSIAFTRSNRSKQWLLFKAFANAAAFSVEMVLPFLTNTRHSSPPQNITFGSFHAPISMLSTESCRADVAQASTRRHLLHPAVHGRHPGHWYQTPLSIKAYRHDRHHNKTTRECASNIVPCG